MPSKPLTIRENRPEDSANIYSVYESAIRGQCSEHYTACDIEQLISAKNESFYATLDKRFEVVVGEIDSVIVGFGAIDTEKDYIVNLFVSPTYKRNGYAKLILGSLESVLIMRGAKKIHVNSTLNALNFYKKMGYAEIDRIKHVIGDYKFDVVAMIKTVT